MTDPDLDPEELESGLTKVPLAKLLRESEIVSLHVNLCDDTIAFFGRDDFQAMPRGSWFINTAGASWLTSGMLDALKSRHLAGAALDVLCEEESTGMAEHPLVEYAKTHPQLIITPHIGGCTTESMAKTERFLAGRLVSLLSAGGAG